QLGSIDKGLYKISISDMNGKIVYEQTLDHPGGMVSQVVQLPNGISTGMYSLSISGNGVKFFKQFIVK
ncbi:MAG TPA: T9SS type A sorting domain-containing protein, partial [Chitinophagaceae bacterium]|nr:T9SS type A sorting domain-containing protein [Chitinophagaceae bacterium]